VRPAPWRGSIGAVPPSGSREDAPPHAVESWAALAGRLATQPRAGARIAGRYDVLEHIGGGGMGVVYLARDLELERRVALKLVHAGPPASADAARRRLRHEAQAMARLAHPHVLDVFDVCEHRGQIVLVLEYVDGSDLRRHLAERRLAPHEIVDLFAMAAQGLAAAHEAGLVHGDIKPDNVLVGRDGRVRVADFGLASAWSALHDRGAPSVWGAGAGTPRYMAPEQLRGAPATPRSDQFAWCVALQEALDDRAPAAVRRVLARGLCPDPEGRWKDMRALLAALRTRRRARGALGGTLAALGVGVLWWIGDPPSPCASDRVAPPWHTHDRAALRDRVERRGSSTDPARWARVERDLDAFAASWSSVTAEVCARVAEATPEEQHVALACPTRMGREVDARVVVALEADDSTLPAALGSLATLPDPARCLADTEVEPLDLRVGVDPERWASVSARADALVAAGRYLDALPLARELQAISDTSADRSSSSRAALRVGSILEALGRGAEAQRAFERAALSAEEAGVDDVAARAAFQLVFLFATREEDVQAAEPWFRHGEAASVRAGSTLPLRAELAAAEADLAAARGDLRAARAARERAVQLRTEELGASHPTVATAQHNLAIVTFRLGDYETARDLYLGVLEIRIAELGPDHPLVGSTHGNLGPVYQRLGDLPLAQMHGERALEIAEASFGPAHYQTAAALANLAVALAASGDREGAVKLETRALAILEARLGEDSPNVARILANLGNREAGLGHTDAAEAYLSRALDIHERAGTPPGPERAAIMGGLGLVHVDQGRAREAVAELSWAAETFEATVGRSDAYTLTARAGQVDALRVAGDPQAAVAIAEAALAGIEGLEGPVATLEVAYAWALLDRGDVEAAREILARARARDPETEDLAAVEARLPR
jgi:tetratricopeptide (TPR) repeat protein